MAEQLVLVDLFDRPIGTAEKLETHQRGLLHRAFSIFLIDGSRMLIQQRAAHKYHSGGLWANACCSHPRPEEALADAAARRLQEECGAVCPLTELFSFVYRQPFADGLCEYEVDHVLLGRYDGPLTRNPDEAAQLLWIERDELAERLLTRPQDFAAWFVIAAPRVLALTAR